MQALNHNDAVRNLQTYLRALSFYDERIERVPIDGIYDSDTQKAVASFQRTRSLPETSVVDKRTWDMIYEEYSDLMRKTTEAPPPNIFPSKEYGYEVSLGEKSSFVAVIQLMLRELGALFDTFNVIEVDGIYGEETERAVREFQRAAMLEESGRVDLETYNRLNSAFLSLNSAY